MSTPRTLLLSEAQRAELVWVRDHHVKAYMRERAAALLKIAKGSPLSRVAREGLLKPRAPGTIRDWVDRYEADGLEGLRIGSGRGRKPAFSPSTRHKWDSSC